MKQIEQKQIDIILDSFFKANAGVQIYAGLKEMLDNLPEVEKEENKTENKAEKTLTKAK